MTRSAKAPPFTAGAGNLTPAAVATFTASSTAKFCTVTNDVTFAAPYCFVSLATSALAVAAPASAVMAFVIEKWPIEPPATTRETAPCRSGAPV